MKYTAICILATFNLLVYSFVGLNYEAYSKVLNYPQTQAFNKAELDSVVNLLQTKLVKQRQFNNSEISLANTPEEEMEEVVVSKTNHDRSTVSHQPTSYLIIPKINLISPLYSKPEMTIEEALNKLEEGVITLGDFIPPYRTGTNLILGHSSDYSWNNNPYSTIFTLIPKLESGDLIKIISADQTHVYTIRETAITDTELSNLPQVNDKHQLVLSTCWPLGFFNQRFNVIATPSRTDFPTSPQKVSLNL